MPKRRLIIGCGYLGRRVADLWLAAGDEVFAVTRSTTRAATWKDEGLYPVVADVTDPNEFDSLPAADTVLFAVGHDRTAGPSIFDAYAGGLRNVLDALPQQTGRIIYASSTGVYGPAGGDWVDEQTPPNPQRDGGKASLQAEEVLRSHPRGKGGTALRLGGLYGPGRVPHLDKMKSGEPIAAPSQGWLNLIHVEDAARIVTLAAEAPNPSPIYNITDGTPIVRADYYGEAARLLGAPPPTFCPPLPCSPAAKRAAANRRISNGLLMRELAPTLAYPTYREGLAAVLGG